MLHSAEHKAVGCILLFPRDRAVLPLLCHLHQEKRGDRQSLRAVLLLDAQPVKAFSSGWEYAPSQ